ncbi:flavin reductase family protein [Bradyrhizobium sp. WSM3983]|uniref:flavin reductase family protein n=1 Tax=Bradyrhizobium sp. WSM3983 TaxID=1038867 RepID=UPI00041D48FE|nr:flavin reductase family protein [Bradyrhizobium sp. WSM3983]
MQHPNSDDVVGDFKAAMRRLAATVAIVTSQSDGRRHGMTATAVTSLTTTPPSLLVCINRSASIHEPIIRSRQFCVNLLACEHGHLVPIFSGKMTGEERFCSGDWAIGEFEIPYLANAQANVFCSVSETLAHGSHSVFIGNVEKVVLFGEPSPLLYQEGALYKSIALS